VKGTDTIPFLKKPVHWAQRKAAILGERFFTVGIKYKERQLITKLKIKP